jgi:O-antigen/teichoic acid export membrane protein
MERGKRYAAQQRRAPGLRPGRHSRKRNLAHDTGWSAAIQVARLFASLGTFIAFRITIGNGQYGPFAGVQGLVVLSSLLGCFWLPQLVLQRVLRDKVSIQLMATRAISLALVGAAVSFAAIMVFGRIFLPTIPRLALVGLGLAEIAAAVLIETPASLLQAKCGFAASARTRLVTPMCRLVAVAVAILTSVHTLQRFAILVAVTLLPVALVTAFATFRRLGVQPAFGPFLGSDVVGGLSYSVIGGLYVIQDDGDKTMLVSAGFDVDAGRYAAAYRLLQIAMFPINAFVAATHGRFLQFRDTDPPRARFLRAVRFAAPALIYSIVAAVVVFVAASPLASLMGIAGYGVIFRWLCLLLPLRCTAEFALNGLLGLGRNWIRVVIVGISGFSNVAINLVFIPSHSWRAAALATLIADSTLTVLAWAALAVLTRRASGEPITQTEEPKRFAGSATKSGPKRRWGVRPRHGRP